MLWFDTSYAFDKTNEIPNGTYLFVYGLINLSFCLWPYKLFQGNYESLFQLLFHSLSLKQF